MGQDAVNQSKNRRGCMERHLESLRRRLRVHARSAFQTRAMASQGQPRTSQIRFVTKGPKSIFTSTAEEIPMGGRSNQGLSGAKLHDTFLIDSIMRERESFFRKQSLPW